MPTDNAGNHTPVSSYFVQTGDDILPEQQNPVVEDLSAGLTARLMADGRKVWTGDQKAGGNKLTGLGAGVAPDDAATVAQVGTLTNLSEIIKTDDYTITTADAGKAIIANKATAITFALPALASAGTKPYLVRNIGAGDLTLDGNASEQIEGANAITIKQGGAALVWPNGSVWRAFRSFPVSGQAATGDIADDAVTLGKMEHGTQGDVLYYGASGVPTRLAAGANGQFLRTNGAGQNPSWMTAAAFDFQVFTANGTWSKPVGTPDDALVLIKGWGSGGGGGTGSWGGGGGGGCYVSRAMRAGDLASSVSVTVAAGGTAGNSGGDASFGSYLTAYGGGKGGNGTSSGGAGGGGGGGPGGAGSAGGNTSSSLSGAGGAGGGPISGAGASAATSSTSGANGDSSVHGAGGGSGGHSGTGSSSNSGGHGGNSDTGGGGGGGSRSASGTDGNGGVSVHGGGGGGGGTAGSGGTSLYGGNGGNAGQNGVAPGGGGGCNASGAPGKIEIWVIG